MHIIDKPAVYLVGKTTLCADGLAAFLADLGSPNWQTDPQVSDGENLIEVAGRMCYRSWQPYDPEKPAATNPNVGKIRTGNRDYLANVLAHAHGSILEHVNLTFICRGVSRVVTHELVRHRAGMAFSQESLRYVRLDDLGVWLPAALQAKPEAAERFREVVAFLESVQSDMARLFDIDNLKDFATKKELTSLFRRLAPIGLGTTIMVTGNLRAWRHVIAVRTSAHAEEEIRLLLGQIAAICQREYPNVFQDMHHHPDTGEWTFDHAKV